MSYEFKYTPEPVNLNINTSIEGFALELFVGFICAGFSYYGYKNDMLAVFVPMGLISLICFMLRAQSVFAFVAQKLNTLK